MWPHSGPNREPKTSQTPALPRHPLLSLSCPFPSAADMESWLASEHFSEAGCYLCITFAFVIIIVLQRGSSQLCCLTTRLCAALTRAMPPRSRPIRNAPSDFLGEKCPCETKLRKLAWELRTYRTTMDIVRAEYSERVAHGVAAIAVGGFKMAKEQDLLRQRVAGAGDSLSASRDALVKADREMQVLTEAF